MAIEFDRTELQVIEQSLKTTLLGIGSSLDKKEQQRLDGRRRAVQAVLEKALGGKVATDGNGN